MSRRVVVENIAACLKYVLIVVYTSPKLFANLSFKINWLEIIITDKDKFKIYLKKNVLFNWHESSGALI